MVSDFMIFLEKVKFQLLSNDRDLEIDNKIKHMYVNFKVNFSC